MNDENETVAQASRRERIDTVSRFIPGSDEPYRLADRIARDINAAGYTVGRDRPWRRGDVYQAIREMRHDYPEFAVASLPSLGFRYEESATAPEVARSKSWASNQARSRLRNLYRGLVLPLVTTETERAFLTRSFDRLEEDIAAVLAAPPMAG